MADEKSEILARLSPLEPQIRHQGARTRRVGEVKDSLLQTQEYRNWFGGVHEGKSDGSVLFYYEGPRLEKHTLGKRKDSRGNKSIANKL